MNKIKKMPQIDQVSLRANLKIPVKMSGKDKMDAKCATER